MTVLGLAFGSAVSITRPADTNAYTAGDVIGPSTATGGAVLQFNNIGVPGKEAIITTVQLEYDVASLPSGMTNLTLHLYSVSPPSALGDNGAWDLPSGDRASYLGNFSLGTVVDLGSTLYVETTQVNKQITIPGNASGALFGYLVTAAGFTPGSADVFKVTLHAVQP